MNMAQQFTPKDVVKVIKSVIDTQRSNNYKAGWVKHEMERRISEVQSRLLAYHNLAAQAYYVANGEQTMEDFIYWLTESYDDYREMEKRYA